MYNFTDPNALTTPSVRTAAPHLEPSLVRVQASRADVVKALRLVAETHPDTWSAMAVAEALLIRLDTIRDEAGFMGSLIYSHTVKGDPQAGKRTLETMHELLGRWDQKYSMTIQRK